MKNLRIAVVPTETGNSIDQNSSVEEILACDETQLFSVADYCQAQNDDDIDRLHYSFLINIETKENLTGTNTDGIDCNVRSQREEDIKRIKDIIIVWGATTTSELECKSSPCMFSRGNDKKNISELIEEFHSDRVSAITYQNDNEIAWSNYAYEDLSDELIAEILEIIEAYEADMLKTEKRCQD